MNIKLETFCGSDLWEIQESFNNFFDGLEVTILDVEWFTMTSDDSTEDVCQDDAVGLAVMYSIDG